ncbi:MAG: hypothetical protein RLZZ528_1204 [Pseudomonadota bacterium]|jgi:hypothetical protein
MALAIQRHSTSPLSALRRLAGQTLDMLVLLANANGLLKEVEKLNATPDEALTAAGTDRSSEVARIFSARYY